MVFQDKQQERRQGDSTWRSSLAQARRNYAAPEADVSSDETHPQLPPKSELPKVSAFDAPAKSGGSELFDALIMAATGTLILTQPNTSLLHRLVMSLKRVPFAGSSLSLALKAKSTRRGPCFTCLKAVTLGCRLILTAAGLHDKVVCNALPYVKAIWWLPQPDFGLVPDFVPASRG